MNHRLYASAAALLLAVCTAHAADTGQPETQTASEADIPLKEKNYPQERKHPADEAKIARNMAAWDKLMATPEQQYPSFEELEELKRKNPRRNVAALIKHKRNNQEFAKHAVPLKQILPLPDKGITSIEIFYGGMAPPTTNVESERFFDVKNSYSPFEIGLPPGTNLLVDKVLVNDNTYSDMAHFILPPEHFSEFADRLNHVRAWRYPNPQSEFDSIEHRLFVLIIYQDGRQWALGVDSRFLKDQYLEAIIVPELPLAESKYNFVYLSLRDIVLLMQHLDDRVPVFLQTFDYPSSRVVNERRQWKEIMQNMNHTKKPVNTKQSQPRRKRQIHR